MTTDEKFHAWAGGRHGIKYVHNFFKDFEEAKAWIAKMVARRPDYDAYGINAPPDNRVVHVSPRVAKVMNLVPVVLPGDKYPRWVSKQSAAKLQREHESNRALEQG